MLHRILHVVLFVLGLLASSLMLRWLDFMPYFGWTRSKCVHYVANVQQYDTLVLGSSRLHFGFLPSAFDQRMAELGQPSKVFNLAFSGMEPHDFFDLGLWIAERPVVGAHRVLVELTAWNPRDLGTNWMADMQLQTHTARQMLPRLESIWACNTSWAVRWDKGYTVLAHTLVNFLRIGQGPRIADDLLRAARGVTLQGAFPVKDDGFRDVALDAWPANKKAHDELMADPVPADIALAAKRRETFPPVQRGGFNYGAWQAFDSKVRAAGWEPIYIVMPLLSFGFQGRDAVEEIAKKAIVLDLDDPNRHPALFERSLWYDRSHMNRTGAEFLSHYLADLIVKASPRSSQPR